MLNKTLMSCVYLMLSLLTTHAQAVVYLTVEDDESTRTLAATDPLYSGVGTVFIQDISGQACSTGVLINSQTVLTCKHNLRDGEGTEDARGDEIQLVSPENICFELGGVRYDVSAIFPTEGKDSVRLTLDRPVEGEIDYAVPKSITGKKLSTLILKSLPGFEDFKRGVRASRVFTMAGMGRHGFLAQDPSELVQDPYTKRAGYFRLQAETHEGRFRLTWDGGEMDLEERPLVFPTIGDSGAPIWTKNKEASGCWHFIGLWLQGEKTEFGYEGIVELFEETAASLRE